MKKVILLAVFAGMLGLTSCKSKKKAAEKQPEVIEVVEEVKTVEVVKETPLPTPVKTEEGIKITFSSDLLFAFDSADLNEESKKALNELAKMMQKNKKNDIRIDGYTDSTGTVEYNDVLSVKRANSVKDYLASQGVAASRMTVKGYGKSNPIASNNTAEGRHKNRRVDIIILD